MKKIILPSFFILFLSGFIFSVFPSKVFSQDQLKDFYTHEFTIEECQKITASLPQDVFSKLDVGEAMPYLCVVGGSGAKEYEQDVELYILNLTISKPIKSDLQKIYNGDQEFIRPGAIPYKRADIDVDGGKAIVKTNTFPPSLPNDLSSYYGERADSDASIFIGDCLLGFAGRSYTNHETYSDYHYSQDQQVAINAHPDYDHGASSLHKKMLNLTPKIATAIKPFCGETDESSSPSKKETAREWFDRTIGPLLQNEDKQREQFEEPAGRGIGEFIRKIQSLRLGPGYQADKPTQEVKQEPSKTSSQSVDDWILENVGIYEPSITVLNETPLKNREPLIKQGQPNASLAIRKVAESSLLPGARISNYAEGVIVEISRGGWVYIPPSGEVIYGTQDWRRYFDIMMGTVEVETNENSTEVKTPNAIVNTKGTHYWVSYDADKKETKVGVYEGKVEVKTKNSKTMNISPDGGQPGVVVVTQKLSIIKLAVGSLVLISIIGGIILILKRRRFSKGFNKKK